MRKWTGRILTGSLVILFCPAVSEAQTAIPRPALRTGIGFNPDQFHAGLHVPVNSSMTPEIRPVVDLGLGNGVRLLGVSGDILYHLNGRRWRPYLGGGPGVNFIDVTDGVGEAEGMTAKLVAHAVTGIGWTPGLGRNRYFLEGRFGFGDAPDLRISLGMSF